MASYVVNERALEKARRVIEGRQYVLDSDWGTWSRLPPQRVISRLTSSEEYGEWHLVLTEGA
jgi:hypothetical protein